MATEGKLRLTPILRFVWRVYRSRWALLVPLSVVILLPQALADALIGDIELERVHTAADVLKLVSIPLTIAVNLAGEVLLAGIVAAVTIAWLEGSGERNLRAVARSIEYKRLIVLDLALAVGTTLGLVLLIIPGVLFYTYMAVSPALIEIKGHTVRQAMRESFDLVRGNFWRVLVFSLSVLLISQIVASAIESPLHGVKGELALNLVFEAAFEPFWALTTVFLALALLDLHGRDTLLAAYRRRAETSV